MLLESTSGTNSLYSSPERDEKELKFHLFRKAGGIRPLCASSMRAITIPAQKDLITKRRQQALACIRTFEHRVNGARNAFRSQGDPAEFRVGYDFSCTDGCVHTFSLYVPIVVKLWLSTMYARGFSPYCPSI